MTRRTRKKIRPIVPFALAAAGLVAGALAPSTDVDAVESQGANGAIRWVILGVDTDRGGRVRCALYRNEHDWLHRSRAFRKSSADASHRQVACVFRRVPPGTYAMAALHDTDGDRRMDKSLIGLPREGYAISRDETDRLSAPDFDDAAIQFEGGEARYTSRMHY